jgi:cytochrome P450
MSTSDPVITDHFASPESWENPYPGYARFRAASPIIAEWPVTMLDGTRFKIQTWMALQHEQVSAALRDPATFSSQNPAPGSFAPKLVMIQDDPPRHTRFRRLVSKAFTARRIAELAPWIKSVAQSLLDRIAAGDSVNIVDAFTMPLPVQVIARMLGIPGEDQAAFKRWSDSFVAINSAEIPKDERQRNNAEMMEYFGKVVAARREKSGTDLISGLVEADAEGEHLEQWEILGFCMLLLIAGNETTTNLMSNLLNILAARPELWRRLRDDRTLVEFAIEETLRYESPVQMLVRFVTRDTEIGGRKIFQGQPFALSYGAANRDPAVFSHPEEFRLDRGDWTRHLGFGGGIHYCLGAPLARMEAGIMLNAMLDRFSSVEHGDEPARRQRASNVLFGFSRLPLRFAA